MANSPPELTVAARAVVGLLGATEHWSRRRALSLAILAQACVIGFEWTTASTVNTGIAYMCGCAVAVWCLGERDGLLLGLAVAIAGSFVKYHQHAVLGLPHIAPAPMAWNTAARCLSVALIGCAVNGMRSALALERWRASSDGLTGALNKAAFHARMAATIAHARAHRRALVLAYMDLDGFKGVNDGAGHAAGDRVLRSFASGAADAIRADDLFARIGGDEFVALMAVRSSDDGDRVAMMLHRRLSAVLAATGHDVTCSMGALVADARAIDADGNALELADLLMYEVKRAGKNALRIAHVEPAVAQWDASVIRPAVHDRAASPAGERRAA